MLCAQDLSKCQVTSTFTTLQAVKNQQAPNVFLKCGSWVNSRLGQPLSEPPENRRQEPKPIPAWKDMYIGISCLAFSLKMIQWSNVEIQSLKTSNWYDALFGIQSIFVFFFMVDIWLLGVGIPQDRFTFQDPFEHLWDTYCTGKNAAKKSTKI